jgi:hypothetical protein
MAKALYGHLARPAVDARLLAEIERLRRRIRDLEIDNARLREAADPVSAPDDLTGLPGLAEIEASLEGSDPAFA